MSKSRGENETQTLSMEEELKSIQGFYISCMGSPLYRGVTREKQGSQSSCNRGNKVYGQRDQRNSVLTEPNETTRFTRRGQTNTYIK